MILEITFGIVFVHQIKIVSFWVIDDFVKPGDIWMIETLKDLDFFFHVVIGGFGFDEAATNLGFLKGLSVHFLDCIENIVLSVFAQMYG